MSDLHKQRVDTVELGGRKFIWVLARDKQESAVKRLRPHRGFSRRRSRVTNKGFTHVGGVQLTFQRGRLRGAGAHSSQDPYLLQRQGSSEFTMELETKQVLQFFVPLLVKGPSYKK